MPDKKDDAKKVAYLDETQVDFIADVQKLLDDAKAGHLVGLTCIKMDSQYFLQADQFGIIPDDSTLIGTLAEMSAAVISESVVNKAIEAVTTELDS